MNETSFDDLYISASQRRPPLNNMGVGSMAIDKVALPNPTTFRLSRLLEPFHYHFLTRMGDC